MSNLRHRIVGLARTVDRKVFRRSVALLDRVGELSAEVKQARAEIGTLHSAIEAHIVAIEQERRETRAQFVVLRDAVARFAQRHSES